jgi:hypothetical protein
MTQCVCTFLLSFSFLKDYGQILSRGHRASEGHQNSKRGAEPNPLLFLSWEQVVEGEEHVPLISGNQSHSLSKIEQGGCFPALGGGRQNPSALQ